LTEDIMKQHEDDRGPRTADREKKGRPIGKEGGSLARAEDLLFEIRTLRAEISILEGNAEREISRVRGRYREELDPRGEKLRIIEAELLGLMKREKGEIFAITDKIELTHGFLFYALGWKIKIPRGALARIEAEGWDEAIRTVKSIDRAVVEAWSEDRLAKIGAEKKRTENFSFEVRRNGLEGDGDAKI
jgi:hypothetical protein